MNPCQSLTVQGASYQSGIGPFSPQPNQKRKRVEEGDRFIPNPRAIRKSGSFETFNLKRPKTPFQQEIVKAAFADFSPRVLLNGYAKPFLAHSNRSWKFPAEASHVLEAPNAGNDFYKNALDWSPHELLTVAFSDRCYVSLRCRPGQANRSEARLASQEDNEREICSVKWSPDGNKLAYGTEGARIVLMDYVVYRDSAPLFAIQFSNEVELVSDEMRPSCFHRYNSIDWLTETTFVVGTSKHIYCLDTRVGTVVKKFFFPLEKNICSLRSNTNAGRYLLAMGGGSGKVSIFDIRTFKETTRTLKEITSYSHGNASVKALQWREGHPMHLLSGGGKSERTIKLYDTREQKVRCESSAGSQVCSVAWLDERHFVVGLGDGTNDEEAPKIQFWRYVPKKMKFKLVSDHLKMNPGSRVLDVVKNPNGPQIVSLSSDEAVRVWDFEPISRRPQHKPDPDFARYAIIR